MFIAKRFNDEVLVQADTEQEAIQQLIENYGFTVEETNEEVVTFDGVDMLESKKQEILNARAEQEKQNQIKEIKKQLEAIDMRSQRSVRAIINGTETQADRDYLADLEQQAITLRGELNDL